MMNDSGGWFHVMANTFGTWLPGDPHGWRSRWHREHVEGDYKNPPKDSYRKRHEHAKRSMKRDAVVLSEDARGVAVDAIVYALRDVHGLEVLAVSVGGMHLHVLARFGVPGMKPTASRRGLRHRDLKWADPARYYLGIAKERSAKALAQQQLVKPGGVWAKRGKIVPVADRQHQVNVFFYIIDHLQEGAAVWNFKHGKIEPT